MQFKSSSSTNKNIEKEFKNLRKELLDLTLRNPLLNFKSRNKTLNIINQNPTNVYKTLVLENKRMHFTPNKKEDKNKISKAHAFISQTMDIFSTIEGDKSLKVDLSPSELQKRLFYIDQQAKTMVQEQGYNILYLACGFVEWIDKRKPKQKNLAPLILIPVEIERKKAGNSFSISWTGEDLQHNISLEAKFKEDDIQIPKFEPISYIEGVNQYLQSVEKSISHYRNWKVLDKVSLGFFSFTKFVMYNDLNPESWKHDVDLTKNELIEAIFNPSKNVYDDTFTEDEIDEKLHYKTMYQVLDADSSQIAVIENVKAGHNLVVEGPPGTGKSQTIVNLIAELIAEGKTVLFVSEKMAALEVVKNRLDSVGLGKFVLELHSHKTRRKKLLKDLQKSTNVRATRDLKLDQTLRKLENLRNQLDEYAEVIHKPSYAVGLTPYELYGMKESAEDYFTRNNKVLPLVRFENPEEITLKNLDDIIISLENLSELYGTITKNNPWNYCNPKSLLPADLREIELLIRDTLDSLSEFSFEISSVNEIYGIKAPNTLREYEDSIEALRLLDTDNARFVDSSILLNKEWYESPQTAYELISLLEKYQKSARLFDKFSDNILVADLDTLIYNLKKDSNKKFRLFGSNPYKEELALLYKGEVPDNKEALHDLILLNQNIKVRQSISSNEKLAKRYFGKLWSRNANPVELEELSNWMDKFTYLVSNGTFTQATINLLSRDLFTFNIDLDMADYIEQGNKFYSNLRSLESKLNPRSKLIFKRDTEDVPFESWKNQLNKWKGQLSSLHLWSQYSNTKKACMNSDAEIFIRTIEKRNIRKDEIKSLVLGNFADSLLNIVFGENDVLATFIGELHENRIEEFKDLDKKIINLNRKRIFNKLNSQIPKIYGEAENPEAKVLAGEFTRKSGHLPVKNLLEKAGGTIKKIKPIFMMSPLSIAQYLDPTNPKLQFDVVIFDEASQMKPEDALGAFMRGKTAVVMGDTQQLPPTSFFDQMTDSESGEEVATALDMESILHLCKLSFPVKMLKWHYRSRHESLINISNKEFYDNELLVYPSPSHNDPELGLKFHYHGDTAYHRGNSSANPKEAKYVVKEIFNHFAKYGDKKSLGVGTFSVAQKNAILEELEIERKLHPEFEPLFSDKKPERFFVKNLETIQGDERDVILISVGYGYDTEGKMSLNFGPLNQDGGERRLNVLITRAREKCVIFTNFKAHDMHLTANPPFGVKSLRNFLEYAENINLNNHMIEEYEESPFEDAIYNFLVENGYAVDKNIGCAGFRVDLAICDPENPGRYVLGIECDGRTYASSKVARDRDRLRDQVLTGLGWNIYHLWSTDWYRNRELARDKLLNYVESTIKGSKYNEIHSKLKDFESMKITPVTSVIIPKASDRDVEEDVEDKSTDIKPVINDTEDNNLEIDNSKDNSNILITNNKKVNIKKDIDLNDEYIETEEDLSAEYISDEISAYKTSSDEFIEDNKLNNSNSQDIQIDNSNYKDELEDNNLENKDDNMKDSEKEEIINKYLDDLDEESEDNSILRDNSKNTIKLRNKLQSYKESINKISEDFNQIIKDNEVIHNQDKTNKDDEIINNYENNTEHTVVRDNNINNLSIPKPKFKSEFDESILKENYMKTLPDTLEETNEKMRSDYDMEYDVDELLKESEENPKINDDENYQYQNELEENSLPIDYNDEEYIDNITSFDGFNGEILSDEDYEARYEEDWEDDEIYIDENGKDGINYYESAVNIGNALARNGIREPNRRRNGDRSIIGSIGEFKNEMKYINEACKVIENPMEKQDIYVIDRIKDDFNEYNETVNVDNLENSKVDEILEFYEQNDVSQGLYENYESDYSDDLEYENYETDYIEPLKEESVIDYDNSNLSDVNYIEPNFDNIDSIDYNDSDVIVPIYGEDNLEEVVPKENQEISGSTSYETSTQDDKILEDVISSADEDYKEIEKTRIEESNVLKSHDTTKLTPKGKIEDYIFNYVECKDIEIKSSKTLYEDSKLLVKDVNNIVLVESPIHINDLILRFRESCGLSRAGTKFKQTIKDAISENEKDGNIVILEDFLFANDKEVKVRKRIKPNVDFISSVEIEASILLILSFNKSMKLDELTREVAKSFGFKSTSKKTAKKIHSTLDGMIGQEKLVNINNRIEFNE